MLYRVSQFWLAIHSQPNPEDLHEAARRLGPQLFALFRQMQPAEQAHSLQVMRRLQQQDHADPDLLAAALLHDCGKARYPLRLWERVWIVAARAALPGKARSWGRQPYEALPGLPFWQRPLVAAENHAAWGAELAACASASSLTIALIRRHQDKLPAGAARSAASGEDGLLAALQGADNES